MDTHRGSDNSSSGRTRSSSRAKRKPFSDITNFPSPRLKPKPKSKPEPKSRPEPDPEPAFSSTAGEQENDGDLASAASTPGKDVHNNDKLDICTVSTPLDKARRKGKEKAVEAVQTSSCPPLARSRSIEGNIRSEDYVANLHKAFSVPRDKIKQRKQHDGLSAKLLKPILPSDFVEKQRAYFAEIDAFELPEEEVSDGELE